MTRVLQSSLESLRTTCYASDNIHTIAGLSQLGKVVHRCERPVALCGIGVNRPTTGRRQRASEDHGASISTELAFGGGCSGAALHRVKSKCQVVFLDLIDRGPSQGSLVKNRPSPAHQPQPAAISRP